MQTVHSIVHLICALALARIIFLTIGQYRKLKAGTATEYEPSTQMAWSDTKSNWDFRTRVENGFWGCTETWELMTMYSGVYALAWIIIGLLMYFS